MNHIPDTGKMVSETPRTDANTYDALAGAARCTPSIEYAYVPVTLSRELERELNRSNEMFRKLNIHAIDLTDRIRRLEEAGDAHMEWVPVSFQSAWKQAKEAKP